jgi:hypothetical protein
MMLGVPLRVETRYSKSVSLGGAGVVIWNPKLTESPTTPVPTVDRKILEPEGAEFTTNWSKSIPANEHPPILRTFVFRTVKQATGEALASVQKPRSAMVRHTTFFTLSSDRSKP